MSRIDKYYTHVEPNLDKIEEMALTMTEGQIAETLGISYSAWRKYKTQHKEVEDRLKKGRKNLIMDLRGALIKKAKGYEYTETKVVTEAVKWPEDLYNMLLDAGFSSEEIGQSQLVRTEVYRKQAAPDVAALNLALKNYDKDNWSNDPQNLELKKRELELKEKQIEANNW